MIDYYTAEELNQLGFKSIGDNVRISKTTTIYNCNKIRIGSNVRIDNFCVIAISGEATLSIGDYVHISAYNFINGLANIEIENFVTTAPYVRIFSSSDDYSGHYLTNTTVPKHMIGTVSSNVLLKKHTIIGTGSTIIQGVTLEIGTAVAAHSFVNRSTKEFTIVGGVPARFLKIRSREVLELEKRITQK